MEKKVTSWERRGKEEGKEEGKKEATKMIVKNMLKKGYNIQEIIKITGYSKNEIETIKREIN